MNKIGSLCTGYGGLDIAVERVLGGEMAWYSEFESGPSKLLSHRFPGVPNLGDLTKIDWADVTPIDILTGGYPCQPFSNAGKRLGEQDSRHLWPSIREAIRVLRPRLTILENVAGHRSKGFATVLRDCAEDGLSVVWVSVRASNVGAPHGRDRLFFAVTYPGSAELGQPRFSVLGAEKVPASYVSVRSLPGEKLKLLSTPQCRDHKGAPKDGFCEKSLPRDARVMHDGWGEYSPAISHFEFLTGRAAPPPTRPGRGGKPTLNPEFSEWMMGLPSGWVTDPELGLTRVEQLRLIGNGVVPQQAEAAIRLLLT